MFSDETKIVQFSGAPKYTVKQPSSTMVCTCMAGEGRGALWIMPKNITITFKVSSKTTYAHP